MVHSTPAPIDNVGSLGKKMLNDRVDESKIEKWSKRVVNEMYISEIILVRKGPRLKNVRDLFCIHNCIVADVSLTLFMK